MTAAQPVAAAAVGDGPVYPVLFRARRGTGPGGAVAGRGHGTDAQDDQQPSRWSWLDATVRGKVLVGPTAGGGRGPRFSQVLVVEFA